MESTTNPTPTPSSASDAGNGDGVYTDEFTKLPPNSPHGGSEKEDGVDFGQEQQGTESNEAIDTENGSRSVDKNQYSETEALVRAKISQTEPDSLDDDVETVIKNQHKYYIYCPCCGEDITKKVKLVKKSDVQPTKNHDTENEALDSRNGSRSKDKTAKVPSWFPVYLQQLFRSVYGHNKDKGKKGVDTKSPGSSIDLATDGEEPIIDVKIEKDRPSFPKWYLDVFAWLFLLCIIIALSVLSTSPQQSPPFIPPHLELPSISSLWLPSASVLLILPTFVVLILVITAMRSRYSSIYHKEKGQKGVDTKFINTTSEEQSQEAQYHDDQAANPDQASDKKTDNQKIHPIPLDPSQQEQTFMQIVNKETHEYAETETPARTQAEPVLLPNTQPEIPNSVEARKGSSNKVEILKSIVYGGLTESITSLCTVTSAAATGASTLNVLALGVANLSSGLLLIVHSLQELINEKPRIRTNTDDQKTSEAEEEEDRYEEILGRREKSRLHRLIAISSFVVFGLIPPLVYGFSFRRRVEKRQEYKTLAVYAASLLCVVLLSVAKAYVSKRREYLKTLFRYTAMATTASGLSQFVGYLVSQWLEKNGFYDDSPETPRV